MTVFMGTEKVVIGHPQSQIITGTIVTVKTICRTVGSLVGTVQPFYHLLIGAEFFRDGIFVRQADYLCDVEVEVILELFGKLHCGQCGYAL